MPKHKWDGPVSKERAMALNNQRSPKPPVLQSGMGKIMLQTGKNFHNHIYCATCPKFLKMGVRTGAMKSEWVTAMKSGTLTTHSDISILSVSLLYHYHSQGLNMYGADRCFSMLAITWHNTDPYKVWRHSGKLFSSSALKFNLWLNMHRKLLLISPNR